MSQGESWRRRDPRRQGSGTCRAAFELIAGEVIRGDGEGAATENLDELPYRSVTCPIEPLDAEVPFDPAVAATLIRGRACA